MSGAQLPETMKLSHQLLLRRRAEDEVLAFLSVRGVDVYAIPRVSITWLSDGKTLTAQVEIAVPQEALSPETAALLGLGAINEAQ